MDHDDDEAFNGLTAGAFNQLEAAMGSALYETQISNAKALADAHVRRDDADTARVDAIRKFIATVTGILVLVAIPVLVVLLKWAWQW